MAGADNENDPRQSKKAWGAAYAKATTLAFLLPTSVFVGYAIGWALDRWFGTTWLKIVFLLLGVAAGFVSLIREIGKGEDRN